MLRSNFDVSEVIGDFSCPPGYQPETCKCQEANCSGARFENGSICIAFDGNVSIQYVLSSSPVRKLDTGLKF